MDYNGLHTKFVEVLVLISCYIDVNPSFKYSVSLLITKK